MRPQEKHITHATAAASGDIEIVLHATLPKQLKTLALSLVGPALAADEFGMVYLWRETGEFFSFMLSVAPGTSRSDSIDFGDHGPVIPGGEGYCLAWSFGNYSGAKTIFADILFGDA